SGSWRTARSGCTSRTCPGSTTPWSTPGCTCPGSGPASGSGCPRPGRRRAPGSGPVTSWPWRCSTSTVRPSRTPGCPGTTSWAGADNRASAVAEVLVVVRERQPDRSWKHDYLLSNAPADTPAAEFARVLKAHHRVEECLQRAKGEAGLADYQVRTWGGWHHHQA